MKGNQVKIKLEVKDLVRKLPRNNGNGCSVITLPKSYIGKTVCMIPVNYKTKIPKPDDNGIISLTVKSSEIYMKEVSNGITHGAVYLPEHLSKVDVLIYLAPEFNYDPLIM